MLEDVRKAAFELFGDLIRTSLSLFHPHVDDIIRLALPSFGSNDVAVANNSIWSICELARAMCRIRKEAFAVYLYKVLETMISKYDEVQDHKQRGGALPRRLSYIIIMTVWAQLIDRTCWWWERST
jgi:hypothetical protein